MGPLGVLTHDTTVCAESQHGLKHVCTGAGIGEGIAEWAAPIDQGKWALWVR